jgi:hypothetical protein
MWRSLARLLGLGGLERLASPRAVRWGVWLDGQLDGDGLVGACPRPEPLMGVGSRCQRREGAIRPDQTEWSSRWPARRAAPSRAIMSLDGGCFSRCLWLAGPRRERAYEQATAWMPGPGVRGIRNDPQPTARIELAIVAETGAPVTCAATRQPDGDVNRHRASSAAVALAACRRLQLCARHNALVCLMPSRKEGRRQLWPPRQATRRPSLG